MTNIDIWLTRLKHGQYRGSIEVSASSAKTAKHVAVIADGGSDDDNVAAETFDVA